jgi:dihydroneopterin aldolase
MMMKTQLTLKNYKLKINLGWTEAERQTKQTVYLDIKIRFLEPPKAVLTDKIAETICYEELTKSIDEFCVDKSFKLLEYFAHELYKFLHDKIAANMMLRVTKPQPCPNLEASVFTFGDFLENDA